MSENQENYKEVQNSELSKNKCCQAFKRERNLDRITILSAGFLFVFIAFNSAANISG